MKSHLKSMLLAAIIVAYTRDWATAMNAIFGTNIEWFWGLPVGAMVAWAVWDGCLKKKDSATSF